ncbi:thiopeptide maturation pyridine synthase [Kitasatospora sp. NPDC049258]|uniref:thiopeptide maturation pyridine synthase n=1 Tax=Kitasatospora sp. NPDC049258 TaxID=3155394 RepID=UPI0034288DB9
MHPSDLAPTPAPTPVLTRAAPATSWHSIQLHHRTPDRTDLLLRAVRPLFAELEGAVEAQYFMPHWRRGSHLRLQFRTTPEVFERTVRPTAEAVLGSYLAEHPSTERVDEESELRLHRRLAFVEWELGPLTPFHPDNSLQYEPFDGRGHVVGSAAAAELLGSFHADTTPLAFAVLERAGGHAGRLAAAFDLMVATAHLVHSVPRTASSFRSHSEAFIATSSAPEQVRAHLDRQYGSRAQSLRARLRAVVDAVDAGDDSIPHLAEWAGLERALHSRAKELIAAGEISLKNSETQREDIDEAAMTTAFLERSPFHRGLDPAAYRQLLDSVDYQAYRLVINHLYLLMTRLGLRPVDRFTLCHLVASAADVPVTGAEPGAADPDAAEPDAAEPGPAGG